MAEVDNLEIKVEATSRGANQQLKILIGMMDELSAKLNGMNTKNFESLATLMKSLASMNGVVKNASNSLKETTKELTNVSNASKKAKEVIADMNANASKIGRNIPIPTGLKAQQTELQKVANKYNDLLQLQEKYSYTGISMDSQSWVNLQFNLIKTKNRMDDLKEAIETTKANVIDGIKFDIDTPNFQQEISGKLGGSIDDLKLRIAELPDIFREIKLNNNATSEVQLLQGEYGKLREKLLELINIYNTSSVASKNFTDTSNGTTPFNQASEAVQEIEKVADKLSVLKSQLSDSTRSANSFEEQFRKSMQGIPVEELKHRLAQCRTEVVTLEEELGSISGKIKDVKLGSIGKDIGIDTKETLGAMNDLEEYNKRIVVLEQMISELTNKTNNYKALLGQAVGTNWSESVMNGFSKANTYIGGVIDKIKGKFSELKNYLSNTTIGKGLVGSFSTFKADAESTGSKLEALKLGFSSLKDYMSNTGHSGLALASGALSGIAGACSVAVSATKGVVSALSKVKNVASKVTPVFKTIGTVALKSFSKIASVGVAPVAKAFKGLGGVLGSVNKKIQRTAKMFSLMIVRKALRAVIDNITNSFKELAKQNDSVNASVSSIVSNFKYLGASITAAFSPIFSVVAPILDALVQKCVSVINTIGQVFASLTGSSTYTVAKKVQVDYAGSLDDTAKSANNATKAVKEYENQLMGFDEINKLSDNKGSGSSGSGGSGGGANGSSPEYVFETANVENQYNKWADMIKEAWNNGDFTELGQIAGQKIADALNSIPWDKIQEQANKIASSVATFINGAMHSDLFSAVGTTIGQALNTAFGMAYTFIEKFEFDTFGTKVAELLNSAFDVIDFDLIANTITGSINGVFESILNFATNFKWGENSQKIADGIKTLFDGIDWDTITKSLEESGKGLGEAINKLFYVDEDRSLGSDLSKAVWSAFNSLVSGIDSFIKETDWKKIGKNLSDAVFGVITDVDWKKLAKTASDAVVGALDLLLGAIKGVNWSKLGKDLYKAVKDVFTGIKWGEIVKKAWDLLVSAVKAVFGLIGGIFGGIAGDIYKGLTSGLSKKFKDIGGWLKTNILNKISSAFSSKKISTNISVGVKLAKKGWTSIKKWIMGKVSSFKLPIHLPKIKVEWGEKKVAGFKIKFPKGFSTYAQGGFPDMGQMFIAREKGPELVGKIGTRNAVVNNNQIVEGVANGVYNAVVSAMATVGNSNGNVTVNLVGDTKKLFKVVQQEGRNYQLATGNSVF